MNRFHWLIAITIAIGSSAQSGCGNGEISWNEEVRLQSGDLITIKRTARTIPLGSIGENKGWEVDRMTIESSKPIADQPFQRWEGKFLPLILDKELKTGDWFIVATLTSCSSWYQLGRPKLPYTVFRANAGVWRQQPLSPKLIGRDANVLTRIHSGGEPDHTIASKAAIENSNTTPLEFMRVVDNWSPGGC